ncbi:MAG: 2-C-methyl-D-erythritol 4-phosphate cytidylyltransferase [Firmicutes bacterium]|nr:2-C-methyl-D-erythritol 4-phosphate cytidylyltransferase [Bacillota bacterium]
MKNIAIIFAGGSGARMGSGLPKQFIEVEGKPIIIHTLDIFEDHPMIDEIYIACKPDYIKTLEKMVKRNMITKVTRIVEGGVSGQDSIYNGICAAFEDNGPDNIVLIHDGVRPILSEDTITNNIISAKEKGSAITCTKFFETPIISTGGDIVEDSPDRESFYTAQAPQTFMLGDVLDAHKEIRKTNPRYEGVIDTCTLMRTLGKTVHIVEGNRGNIKVTTPEDLFMFKAMLEYKETQQALGLSSREVLERLEK